MRIHRSKLPREAILKHRLDSLFHDDCIYFEVRKCLYGLPQSGKLSQTRLVNHLSSHGYHQLPNVPCLFKHATRNITFSLVVDDFGVSYQHPSDFQHLVETLKSNDYLLTIQPEGNTYLGMHIKFNYIKNYVTISMPGYLEKALTRFRPHFLLRGLLSL